ncbi:MAG: hypothetical protein ACYDDF_02985 [Thermoplasmatota archaeon]
MVGPAMWLLVSLHILGASVWLGGQIVLAPLASAVRQTVAEPRATFAAIARRAQPVLWAGFALAAVTGVALVYAGALTWTGLVLVKVGLALASAFGAAVHVVGSRRRWGPAAVGGGAAIALLASLSLVVVGVLIASG